MTKIWTSHRMDLNNVTPQWTRPRTRKWGTTIPPPTTLRRNTRGSTRSFVSDPFEEKNDACQQKPGTDDGQLPGKRDDLKSRQTPATQRLQIKLALTKIIQWTTWRPLGHKIRTPQNRKTFQPTPSAPKRWDSINCQTHHQKGPAERLGVPHTKMGKVRRQSPRPPPSSYPKTWVRMPAVIKLATLNINGIINLTRVGMLTEYIRRHDLDIIFLQEITDPELIQIPGYDVY